jgi:hypothetical protein
MQSILRHPSRASIKNGNFVFFELVMILSVLVFYSGCASSSAKLTCTEIRARMEYQNLSEDEKRVAEQELKDCEQKIQEASHQDSAAIRRFENRLSPQEDSL